MYLKIQSKRYKLIITDDVITKNNVIASLSVL